MTTLSAPLAVTADQIGTDKPFGLGAHFGYGRHGAITINDYRHGEDDADYHPIAYLPKGGEFTVPEAQALLDKWLASDRQTWTEAQTEAFLAELRKDATP